MKSNNQKKQKKKKVHYVDPSFKTLKWRNNPNFHQQCNIVLKVTYPHSIIDYTKGDE